MSNPKRYENSAERQAAYRHRNADGKPPREAELAALARNLHIVIEEAIEAGSTAFPADVLGDHAGETLRCMIHFLDPSPDPVRYEGTKKPGT